MCSVLNCHNVARHAKFYLGELRFNVISTRDVRCFKKIFTTLQAYLNFFRGRVQS
jgi:hypothetical protein